MEEIRVSHSFTQSLLEFTIDICLSLRSHRFGSHRRLSQLLPRKKKAKEMPGPVDVNKDLVVEISGISHETEDTVALLQVKEDALMHEQILISDTLLSPSFDIVTSSITELVSSRNSELTDLSSLPSLSEPNVLPITFGTKKDKKHLDGYEQEFEFGSELAMLMGGTELTAATVP